MRTIKAVNELTKEDLLSESVLKEAFEIEDEVKRAVLIANMRQRAKDYGCVRGFDKIIKSFENTLEAARKEQKAEIARQIVNGITNFNGLETQFRCGQWIASDAGIFQRNANPYYPDHLACYHPIIPVERMKNLQTSEEQMKLTYKRSNETTWSTIKVPKDVIASHQKIVELSKYGVAVTSENAKWLVSYLSDIENLNSDIIPLQYSTSKLGWLKHNGENCFIPYRSNGIEFDGDIKFRQIFGAIKESGDYNVWLNHMLELRATKRLEPRIMMAASFASALIKPCGTLPFIIDLWGDTEGGKTVTLMVAASIWADPSNNAYIGDFKTTDTALEAKADMLNSLPLILDDTSKVSRKLKDSFEGLVYDLCSGKGKSRSNKTLGINRENTWDCSILTCGEKPLQDYTDQGGAINRIIEVQCSDYLYKDPHETAEIVKNNFGFAGKLFTQGITLIAENELKMMQAEMFGKINREDKMQKQAYAMSVILLADRIAEKLIFQDGITITPDEAISVMTERLDVSDNQRAYEHIMDKVEMNPARFEPATDKAVEQWGYKEPDTGYVNFFTSALESLLQEAGYGLRPFLSWLDKNGLLNRDNDGKHMSVQKRHIGRKIRVYSIKMPEYEDDKDQEQTGNDDDYTQAELDFGFNDMV